MDAEELLADIERGVVDEGSTLASLLRKAVLLGGHAGSAQLRDWARQELEGYDELDSVPTYRKAYAPICIDGIAGNSKITNQQWGSDQLPEAAREAGIDETVPLAMGVGEIEAMANRSENSVKLTLPRSTLITRMLNAELDQPFQNVHSIYWNLSTTSVRGVVDKIRTKLAELVSEITDARSATGGGPVTKEAADNAVRVIVSGERHNVTVTNVGSQSDSAGGVNAQAGDEGRVESSGTNSTAVTSQSEHENGGFWTRLRKRGVLVAFATVVAAVAAVAEWMQWTPWH